MHLFFPNVQWHQQISLKIDSLWAIDHCLRNAKVSKTLAARRFIWALSQSSRCDAASSTLRYPSSFPERTPFGPLWVLYRIWSSWLCFHRALWNIREEANRKGDLRRLLWKRWKLFVFWKHIFVGGWQLISGGWPLLGPHILWNLILGPSWFGQSSVVFFSKDIALLEEASVWTQSCFRRQSQKTIYVKTLWKAWKHHPHLQRAQSELLGDFQVRRCYLVIGEWAVEFIFLERGTNIESKTIVTIRAQESQS